MMSMHDCELQPFDNARTCVFFCLGGKCRLCAIAGLDHSSGGGRAMCVIYNAHTCILLDTVFVVAEPRCDTTDTGGK